MMLSHYDRLVAIEGNSWGTKTAIQGASERLAPILMTASVTVLGLLPMAVSKRRRLTFNDIFFSSGIVADNEEKRLRSIIAQNIISGRTKYCGINFQSRLLLKPAESR